MEILQPVASFFVRFRDYNVCLFVLVRLFKVSDRPYRCSEHGEVQSE